MIFSDKNFKILTSHLIIHDSIDIKSRILKLIRLSMDDYLFKGMMNDRKISNHFLTLFQHKDELIQHHMLKIILTMLDYDMIQFLIDKKVFFEISQIPISIQQDFPNKIIKKIIEIVSRDGTKDQIEYLKVLDMYHPTTNENEPVDK